MIYNPPPLSCLQKHSPDSRYLDPEYVKALTEDFVNTMKAYGIGATIVETRETPFAVIFDVKPDEGVSVKTFRKLRTEFEVFMASPVEITTEGVQKFTIGMAIKSLHRPIIDLRTILETREFQNNDYDIPVAVGMNILGLPLCIDIAQTPHLLIAGTTGSGKSVFLNDIILSVLYSRSPEQVKFVMIDPKRVELGPYDGLPHMMLPVVSEVNQSMSALYWIDNEMDNRYRMFADVGVRDITGYNNNATEKLPRILVIIDEYMEMMYKARGEMEDTIKRISRMARAAGIHLILVTQRPSSDIITNGIKANIPCRASFTVVDWRESKTILDRTGAERLLGSGDMLYSSAESSVPIHAQAAYVSDNEIDAVISYVREKNPTSL